MAWRNLKFEKSRKITKRSVASRSRKQIIAADQHGICPACGLVLTGAGLDLDHILPLADGGTNEIDNLAWLHTVCHKLKTTKEHIARRKADRIARRLAGERRPRKKIPSRPFSKKQRGFNAK